MRSALQEVYNWVLAAGLTSAHVWITKHFILSTKALIEISAQILASSKPSMMQMPPLMTEEKIRRQKIRPASPETAGSNTFTAMLPVMARVERSLLLLAYFIELDGDVHVPLYERLEAELLRIQSREETRERARQRLAAYSQAGAGALKAICSRNLSLSSSEGPLPYLGL